MIKGSPGDFVVEEIAKTGRTIEVGRTYAAADLGLEERDGRFCVFVLQKSNWNTAQACKEVAGKAGRGIRSIGFAGTKDRRAVTTQLCSLYGADPERLAGVHVKDVLINGAWRSDSAVALGDLLGNSFRIRVAASEAEAPERIRAVHEGLGGRFPNYFGPQRFGARGNNQVVGTHILRGEFEEAAMAFLTDTTGERNADAKEARGRLAEERDFGAALSYFPGYLKYELRVIGYLSRYPTDFANAMRRLPRQIALMLVHSVESEIFNSELAMRMRDGADDPVEGDLVCGSDFYGFPDAAHAERFSRVACPADPFVVGNIVGYDTASVNDYERSIMERMGLEPGDFRVKRMPELNCRGSRRVLFAPYLGFGAAQEGGWTVLRFSLPAGSYATALLDEFVRPSDAPPSAGAVGGEGQEEP